MIRALVVGGREDFVRDRVGVNLRKVGIEVGWHFDFEHPRRADSGIPKGCELVVLLSDMTPGAMAKTVLNAAHGRVPIVRTQRKWSQMLTDLNNAGVLRGSTMSAAGEQFMHNVEALDAKGLMGEIKMPAQLPVRVNTEERSKAKTFEELIEDLKTTAALMLAHEVTSIIVTNEGIDVKQVRNVKVAL